MVRLPIPEELSLQTKTQSTNQPFSKHDTNNQQTLIISKLAKDGHKVPRGVQFLPKDLEPTLGGQKVLQLHLGQQGEKFIFIFC